MRAPTIFSFYVGACGVWMLANSTVVTAEDAAKTPKAKPVPLSVMKQDQNLWKLIVFSDADPDSGPAPLKVHFTSEVYEGSDAVKPKFSWDFGDDSPKVHEQNPTHVYKKPGTYKVLVTATDANDRRGTDDLSIDVEERENE